MAKIFFTFFLFDMRITKILPILPFIAITSLAMPKSLNLSAECNVYDQFVKTEQNFPPSEGSNDEKFLAAAPSPYVDIQGKSMSAIIVVDTKTNVLYKYNEKGVPEMAYRIASGKKSTPTHKGVRIISHTEDYPYRSAYGSKRKRNPKDYGPHIIILRKIDTQTGETASIGEFIHGNRNAQAVKDGLYVSHGCMRMNNDVITQLYKQVKAGQLVIIK